VISSDVVEVLRESPFPHWASQPPVDIEDLGAVRIRNFRPLRLDAGIVLTTSWGSRPALVREAAQGGFRCIEEHWWRRGDSVASLLPADGPDGAGGAARVVDVRPIASPQAQWEYDNRSTPALLIRALRAVLRYRPRQLASVSAYLGPMPDDLGSCAVHITGVTQAVLRFQVCDGSVPVLSAAATFGCGAIKGRR
jgi:hypothetical protein